VPDEVAGASQNSVGVGQEGAAIEAEVTGLRKRLRGKGRPGAVSQCARTLSTVLTRCRTIRGRPAPLPKSCLAPPKPDLRCADHKKRGVPTVRDLVLAIPAVDHPEPAGFPASSLFKSGGEGISHLVAR
jgi:hypothetical protein